MTTPITPESLAKSGSEDGEQLAVMQWCALNLNKYPELKWLHHSPNGGYRGKREAAKFKAMGVKPGFHDLILLVRRGPYPGASIEMKSLKVKNHKDGGATPEQILWANHLIEQGFYVRLCHGWQSAVAVLEDYLNL